jgi:uncharacterized protein YidB (DUF937 family)
LQDLLETFKKNGQSEVAGSWVGAGQNKEIAPHQLEKAIGPEVLATLAQQSGLSREELICGLSSELPRALDKIHPKDGCPKKPNFLNAAENAQK